MRRSFVTSILVAVCTSRLLAQGTISVGPNVQVSKTNPGRRHFETWIAADPSHPNRLLGGAMAEPAEPSRRLFDLLMYASFDGGITWVQTYGHRALLSADPSCAYSADGIAYFAGIAREADRQALDNNLLLYRSEDGGKTWGKPTAPALGYTDRPYVLIDTTNGQYAGRLYLGATAIVEGKGAVQLGFSKDQGATFQWTGLVDTEKRFSRNNGNGVVLSDGTYVSVFSSEDESPKLNWARNAATGQIWAVSSADGGQSLTGPVRVSDWHSAYVDRSTVLASNIPILAADRSAGPFRDRLYVVWSDIQSGRAQIVLSYSSDKGKTWSRPVIVNDDGPRLGSGLGPHDTNPAIAVNHQGVVGVSWLDRRDNPNNFGYYQRFSASWDGGETFAPSVRVSEFPAVFGNGSDLLTALISTRSGGPSGSTTEATMGYGGFTFGGGHTLGLTADAAGIFHPLWVDNRTGVSQVWTARVSVTGAAIVNGDTALADLQNITAKVALEIFHPVYDSNAKTVTTDVYLENISDTALRGPIIARILSVSSGLGSVSAMQGGNGDRGRTIDFDKLPNDLLKPGQRTPAKRIVVRIEGAKWPEGIDGSSPLVQLLQLRIKVLAVEALEAAK